MKIENYLFNHLLILPVIVFLIITITVISGCTQQHNNTVTSSPSKTLTNVEVQISPINPTAMVISRSGDSFVSPLSEPMSYKFATSEAGYATLQGQLIVVDPTMMLPRSDDAIFLVPISKDVHVVTIPQFETGSVPQAAVDEVTGKFVFTNIKPGQYMVVVITMSGAQIPPKTMEDGNLVIINVEDQQIDQITDLGFLRFP